MIPGAVVDQQNLQLHLPGGKLGGNALNFRHEVGQCPLLIVAGYYHRHLGFHSSPPLYNMFFGYYTIPGKANQNVFGTHFQAFRLPVLVESPGDFCYNTK